MIKRINGKYYNTDTTEIICVKESVPHISDFIYIREALHKKRGGEYFLFVTGGPLTKYSTRKSRALLESASGIIPISLDSAKSFARHCMNEDEYYSEFKSSDFNMTLLSAYVDTDTYNVLVSEAEKRTRTLGEMIESMVKYIY